MDLLRSSLYLLFFFIDTATTEIYTLSLHDALPIWKIAINQAIANGQAWIHRARRGRPVVIPVYADSGANQDRKSTRLNSSHANISYAVFCLKKKKQG